MTSLFDDDVDSDIFYTVYHNKFIITFTWITYTIFSVYLCHFSPHHSSSLLEASVV
jgi:hypothetical protein